MQIEEHLLLMKLFDEYGQLLSEKQQIVMDKYLNLDVGESEIAETQNESRQSVHDAITKAKKQLFLFEEKCNFVEKKSKIKANFIKIQAFLQENKISEAKNLIDETIKML